MSRIITVRGNMFDDQQVLLVIPVNCVGVMGAGLAREYRHRFPSEYRIYRDLCRTRRLQLLKPRLIHLEYSQPAVMFPTKRHWREASELSVVDTNLQWLARQLANGELIEYDRVAVPALGAGLGGLPYPRVRELIYLNLSRVGATVYHYPPL